MVEVQRLEVFLRFLRCSRDPLRGSAWSRCKNSRFFAMFNLLARPSAGIGVVDSAVLARPSAGIGVVEVQKPMVFLRFLKFPRDPLRGSAWSRCKNSRFFAISAVLAQPSAGIGVVEVQKLKVFCDFCCSNWSSGVVSWFARLLPEAGATCAEQVAQSNLRRPTCTGQFAQSILPRATCAEQLAQSNLRRATCTEQLAQSTLPGAVSCREKERILQRWADLACDVLLSGQPWSSSM